MTFLTVDQYKEYFSCDENTLILGSPQVAMIANLLGEKFVYAVQSYLCVSLLKNCMSNQTAVAHLSLKIFLLLVGRFSVLFHPCIVWFPSEPPPAFLRTFVGCFHCV